MVVPLAIAKKLGIPVMIIFDADGDYKNDGQRRDHERDNNRLLTLCGLSESPFPEKTLWGNSVVVWPKNIGDAVGDDFTPEKWEKANNKVSADFGHVKLGKNVLYIGEILTQLWDDGERSQSLERLCNAIIQFGKSGG